MVEDEEGKEEEGEEQVGRCGRDGGNRKKEGRSVGGEWIRGCEATVRDEFVNSGMK